MAKHRKQNALVIRIEEEGYLSEHNSIVDFNHASIIKSPVIAEGMARRFNAIMMQSTGMEYDLYIEIIDLGYETTGQSRRYTEG